MQRKVRKPADGPVQGNGFPKAPLEKSIDEKVMGLLRDARIDEISVMGPRAVPSLIKALDDEREVVRESAALALNRIRATNPRYDWGWAVPALTKNLDNSCYAVRLSISELLGWICDVSSVPALLRALGDENETVRLNVAEALKDILEKHPKKDWRKVVLAIAGCLNDKSADVRAYAAGALGVISEKHPEYDWKGVSFSLILALNDENKEVRKKAADALGWFIAKSSPKDLASAIIEYVNGNGGDGLAATDSRTGLLFDMLNYLMRKCGEAMENAA